MKIQTYQDNLNLVLESCDVIMVSLITSLCTGISSFFMIFLDRKTQNLFTRCSHQHACLENWQFVCFDFDNLTQFSVKLSALQLLSEGQPARQLPGLALCLVFNSSLQKIIFDYFKDFSFVKKWSVDLQRTRLSQPLRFTKFEDVFGARRST